MSHPADYSPAQIETVRTMIAAGHTAAEIAKAIGRSRSGVIGMAFRRNFGPWKTVLDKPRPVPNDFAKQWEGSRHKELAKFYGCSLAMVARWVKASGLTRTRLAEQQLPRKPRLVSTRVHGHKPVMSEIYRDMSPAGFAADTLRRDRWVVFRCNADGRQSQGGKFWKCGRVLCTDAELIERAARVERRMAA